MKKLLSVILISAAFVLALAFGASAASDFSVDVTGGAVVTKGDTFEYKVTVNNVSYEGGLIGFDIQLSYDTEFFSLVSVEGSVPETWNADYDDSTAGTVMLYPCEKDGDAEYAITGNGKVVYTVKLKVLDSVTADSSVIKVESASGNTPDFNSTENSTLGEHSVVLQKQLPTPTGLSLTDGNASWDAVDNATSYVLQLYKNGAKVDSEITVNNTSYNFSSTIASNLGGAYTFTVKAESSSDAFTASNVSDASDPYNYRGKLLTPKIAVEIDRLTGKVSYTITDTNPDEAVGSYIISIYKKGESDALYEITGITAAGKGTVDKTLEGGKEYDFTVTAISSDNNPDTGNASSDESSRATAKADSVTGITLSGNPLLSYIEGDTLNLSALVVNVKFASGDEVPVSLKDFEKYGITVTPKHGADLTLSMNGRKITVTLGSFTASEELVITVESGECKHDGETEAEHKDATCGEDGYDKTVCKLCGVAIESTPILATGDHVFDEWRWLFEPTQTIDGIRAHKCTVCGHEETENVTYEDFLASQTTPKDPDPTPDQTIPDVEGSGEITTDPPVNDPLGGLGNIGRIFLIALVVIFAIIVLFIVLAIWSESRGRRRRRSNKRAGSSGKRPPSGRGNGQSRPRK